MLGEVELTLLGVFGLAYLKSKNVKAAFVASWLAVWLATVSIGMILRVVAGQGIAFAFVVVALAFLGALMLGPRLVCSRRLDSRSSTTT